MNVALLLCLQKPKKLKTQIQLVFLLENEKDINLSEDFLQRFDIAQLTYFVLDNRSVYFLLRMLSNSVQQRSLLKLLLVADWLGAVPGDGVFHGILMLRHELVVY